MSTLTVTDIRPDNTLVNYTDKPGDISFNEVQLADFGSMVPANSAYTKDSDAIGAPIGQLAAATNGLYTYSIEFVWKGTEQEHPFI